MLDLSVHLFYAWTFPTLITSVVTQNKNISALFIISHNHVWATARIIKMDTKFGFNMAG